MNTKQDEKLISMVSNARTNTFNTENSASGSISEQLERIRGWAKSSGYTILNENYDEVVSGRNNSPPGLIYMLDNIEVFEVRPTFIVVCDIARISRNLTVYNWYEVKTHSAGIKTLSLSKINNPPLEIPFFDQHEDRSDKIRI